MIIRTIFTFFFALTVFSVGCSPPAPTQAANIVKTDSLTLTTLTNQTVEVSCGQCQFEMEGDGCDLAIRVEGKTYYVDGSGIDDHGDAHGDGGLCNCIRHAAVSGEIKDGRFKATSLELQENDTP